MAKLEVTVKVADLQPFKDLIDVLIKNIDSLPQEVIECLMKFNETESGNEEDKELPQSHCTRPRN